MMTCLRVLGVFAFGMTLWAENLMIGTWRLNPAKSTYSPGPPPKSATITYQMTSDSIKRTGETVDVDGKSTSFEYTAKFDGQYYPITGSDQYDSISLKNIQTQRFEGTLKKSGKVVGRVQWVFSDDGKTMTLIVTGKNVRDQKSKIVGVYEKQ